MRVFCVVLFLFYFSLTIKSQVPKGVIAPEDAAFNAVYAKRSIPSITGKFLDIETGEIAKLAVTYTLVIPFSQRQVTRTVSAASDGSFKLALDYPLPYQQVWFGIGDEFFACLYADKDLYLELDMKKIMAQKNIRYNGDGVRYLGTDGPMNIYLNNYILYKKQEKDQLSNKINQLPRPSSIMTAYTIGELDKLFDLQKKIEDSYIASNPSPFGWILENERMSEYYAKCCDWFTDNTIDNVLWQKIKRHKSYLVSNSSAALYNYMVTYISSLPNNSVPATWMDVSPLKDLDVGEKLVLDSLQESKKMKPAYPYSADNIKKWIAHLQPRIRKIERFRLLDKCIQRIDGEFPPAKADFLKLRLNISKGAYEQQLALDRILPGMHTAWCKSVMKKEYELDAARIQKINDNFAKSAGDMQTTSLGKALFETPFGASLYKASNIKALDFLTKLKQSFPGKAIIIDLWATWCIPCLQEMPHSKQLQEESKDLPVVFVYLCTINESTETKWKAKVNDLEQPGVHFLIDRALDVELSQYFSFNGYPGYAFIDKTGIYRPEAFLRTSQIENKEALAALINK